MGKIIEQFTTRVVKAVCADDVYQVMADTLQSIDKDVYTVCLRVDTETFEM